MIIRIAALSVLTGTGFLAASVFSFLNRSGTTKVGPSLLQGLIDGFGMLWLHLALFLVAFAVVHALVGAIVAWALESIARKLSPHSPENPAIQPRPRDFAWLTISPSWHKINA